MSSRDSFKVTAESVRGLVESWGDEEDNIDDYNFIGPHGQLNLGGNFRDYPRRFSIPEWREK
jgi:hypothetical protein